MVSFHKMSRICRTCLSEITCNSYIDINRSEFARKQLTFCIPELDFGLVLEPLLCTKCVEALNAAYDFISLCLRTEQRIKTHMQTLAIEQPNVELGAVLGNNDGINSIATRCGNDISNDLATVHNHDQGECFATSENFYEKSFDDGVEVNNDSNKEESITIEEHEWESSIKTEKFDTGSDAEKSCSLQQRSEFENRFNLKLQDGDSSKQDVDLNEQLEDIKTELNTASNVATMQSEYNDASAVVNDTVHEHSRTRHDLEDYNDAKGKCSTSENCSETSFHDDIEMNCDSFKEESMEIEEHELTEMFDTDSDTEITCSLQQSSEIENRFNLELQDRDRCTPKQDFGSNDQLESIKTELNTELNVAAIQSECNDASAVVNDTAADHVFLPGPSNTDDFEEHNESSQTNSTKSSGLLQQYNKLHPMNYNANVESCNSSTISAETFTKQGNCVTKSQVGVVSMEPNTSCTSGILLRQCKVNLTKIADISNIQFIKRRFKNISSIKSHSRINKHCKHANRRVPYSCHRKEKTNEEKIVAKSELHSELLRDCRVVLTRMEVDNYAVINGVETQVKKSSHLERYKCDKCDYACSKKGDLVIHMRAHKAEKPYKCEQCDYAFSHKSNLMVHMTKHTGEKPYICNVCDYGSSRNLDLKRHLMTHTGEKPYKCCHCNYAGLTKSSLILHMRNHTGERPYKCEQCDYACSHKSSLTVHMTKHTGEKPYKCNVCDYGCSQKTDFKRHLMTHTGEKPYKCGHCNYAGLTKSNLILHMTNHTGEKRYKCDKCDYACSRKNSLILHMRNHTRERPYKCEQCDYACSHKSSLTLHMMKHTGEKPYKCNVCDYGSSQKINLKRHLMTHTGEKPYKCCHCNYAGLTKSNLILHMTNHTGEKRYNCDKCDYACSRKDSLILHMRNHTRERPYKCEQCDYACSHKSSLTVHMMKHTGEKSYKCNVCDFGSSQKIDLKRHLMTHTGEKQYKW